MLSAKDGRVVKDETEDDRVAVGAAKSVECVFAVEVLPLGDEEIGPLSAAEDRQDVKEFGGERSGELGKGQVELRDVGARLLLGVCGLDLDTSGLAVRAVGDQKVDAEVESGESDGPIAD